MKNAAHLHVHINSNVPLQKHGYNSNRLLSCEDGLPQPTAKTSAKKRVASYKGQKTVSSVYNYDRGNPDLALLLRLRVELLLWEDVVGDENRLKYYKTF